MLRVGFDISSIPYQRGVSRYTANLARALAAHDQVELELYGSSLRQQAALRSFAHEAGLADHLKLQPYPPTALSWLWRMGLNTISNQLPQIDVFHSWDWLQPPDKDLPLVSTIHDLAILKFPETAHPQILKMHQRAWQILKEREAEIIAVSQATKQDIVRELGIPARRVHVVYEALPQETVAMTDSLTEEKYERIKTQLGLSKPYMLFVGTREPRKNLERLIKAWRPLKKDADLIIAGAAGWDETGKSEAGLRFLGQVSDQQLVVLYSEADLLAYPSLYEGFGLPILEAFYFGCPVVTSNISSMPEVAGNAAELVDPLSVDSIQQGLEKILHEDASQQKARLQKMIIRLHLFNWRKVAEETVQVYRRAREGVK